MEESSGKNHGKNGKVFKLLRLAKRHKLLVVLSVLLFLVASGSISYALIAGDKAGNKSGKAVNFFCPYKVYEEPDGSYGSKGDGPEWKLGGKELKWIKDNCPNVVWTSKAKEAAEGNKTGEKKEEASSIWPSLDAKYITAVPLDLTQIKAISKYRSCAGHDRSGYSFERTEESDRSMKHYIYPLLSLQGTLDRVKVFAPFDGTVLKIDLEKDKVGGRPHNGNGIQFGTDVDPNAVFGFGHVYFSRELKVGDKVNAGELVGYAALGNKEFDFDIDLNAKSYYQDKEILGSAFDHMTESVLLEFAKYGITPENMKFSKEERDADPCLYDTNPKQQGREGSQWIQLKH